VAASALLTLEVNLAFKPPHHSYNTMSRELLGRPGQVVTWLSFLFLMYALTSAYIVGSGDLLSQLIPLQLSKMAWSTLATLFVGTFLWFSTYAVDIGNRLLFGLKVCFLAGLLGALFSHVETKNLVQTGNMQYMWLALPIFLYSFGYHVVIPSITSYGGVDAKHYRNIILIGGFIPLFVYLLWLFSTLGIVPLYGPLSFEELARTDMDVGPFLKMLHQHVLQNWLDTFAHFFAIFALGTSFFGIALSLFDFLRDSFAKNQADDRLRARLPFAISTLLPPWLFVVLYPSGFAAALHYAAPFVAMVLLILPAIMVVVLRKSTILHSPYRVSGGLIVPIVVFLTGIGIIILEILKFFNMLPVFGS
jgi:tyrosine-specific transport protein